HPLVAVAVRDRLAATLVALAAKELAQLLLERLLQDQPRAEPADRLDRIELVTGTSHDLVELAAQPLTRGYARHPGVPPRRLPGQRGGYARFISPGSRDATDAPCEYRLPCTTCRSGLPSLQKLGHDPKARPVEALSMTSSQRAPRG